MTSDLDRTTSPSTSTSGNPLHSRHNRRAIFSLLGAGAVASAAGLRHVAAQDGTAEATPPVIQSNTTGEMPTYGGTRSAPVGSQPSQFASASRTRPVTIAVEKIQIQAEIEQLEIVNGTMENPTGPWVVSWYQETAELGEVGNVVLAGHVDYWNVGPAVFYNIRDLTAGDEIVLTGDNDSSFIYAVESNETYDVNALTGGKTAELVAPTPNQVLTLFTCGGEFDYENGEYLSRTVVRATLKPNEATPPA